MFGRYLVSIRRCANPRAKLICFPYGGGGSTVFWEWRLGLPEYVELWAVCLPGREKRIAEPFVTDAVEAVKSIFEEVQSLPDGKYAFYGHSLGAGLAFETAIHLRRNEKALPSLFMASGRVPPHRGYEGTWNDRSDKELADHLTSLGGIPPDLLDNPQFLAAYLPKIRADFKLNESLYYGRSPAFDFPITIIGSTEDPLAAEGLLYEWKSYTTGKFNLFKMNGNHFFIHSHFHELISIVSDQLTVMCI